MDTDIDLEFEYNEEVCKTIDFYQDSYGFGDPRSSMAIHEGQGEENQGIVRSTRRHPRSINEGIVNKN